MREASIAGKAAATLAASLSCLLLVATAPRTAAAAEIKVLSAIALQTALDDLAAQFEKSWGHKVTIGYATVGALTNRIQKGEAADVAIATPQQIANLEKQGRIVAGSRGEIAKVGVGVLVRKGAAKPDIGTVEALERTLLAAKSIAHSDPAAGGAIGIYVADMLARLKVAADIKSKIKTFPPPFFDAIARGDVEIGFGSIGEIVAAPGIEYVGPLPAAVQRYTVYAAGIVAGSKNGDVGAALIRFLSSPAARAAMKAKGFEEP